MGLISKIEDKLSSNKGESDHSKLQKSGYDDQSSSSSRQHPISSGTGSQGYGSSTGTSDTHGYGSSTTGTSGSHGYGSSNTGTSGMAGTYGNERTSGVERDGYGHSSSGYDKMDSRDTAGGYGSSRTDPRDTTSGGYGSSGRTEAREPYDPYSSKGQQTAAAAGTGYSSGTSRDDYGSSGYANDPNVPRSREGGVMNQSSHGSSRNPEAIPTAGGERIGSTDMNDPYSSTTSSRHQDPYSSSTTNSSGHPIRDAAMMGGAGTAAGGAAGYGASRHHDDRSMQDPSVAYGQHSSSRDPQDASYMNRSGGAGGMEPGMGHSSGMTGSDTMGSGMGSGMGSSTTASSNDPRKMGGAYEAGYRDAMEHAKEQMGR